MSGEAIRGQCSIGVITDITIHFAADRTVLTEVCDGHWLPVSLNTDWQGFPRRALPSVKPIYAYK